MNSDAGEVAAAIEAGADPNDFPWWSKPLSTAASKGDAEVVEVLARAGADLMFRDDDGWSAATHADAADHAGIAARLVELGAPSSSVHAHRYTALHRGVRRNDLTEDVIEAHRRDLNRQNSKGATPLLMAIQQRNEDAARLLVRCGADPDLGDDFCSPLAQGAHEDSTRDRSTHFVGMLLEAGAGLDPDGYPPLFLAVPQGGATPAVLGQLVAAGCDINGRLDMPSSVDHGETVLHRIASVKDEVFVDAAIGLGADIDARTCRGRTPLHEAAWCENAATFSRLLDHGADLDTLDDDGNTPAQLVDQLVDPSRRCDKIRTTIEAHRKQRRS